MTNDMSIKVIYDTLAFVGTFSRFHVCLTPKLPILSIHVYLSYYKWALNFISLSIRFVLFMLLVVAGDVERNPGPPKSRTSEGEERELTLFMHVYMTMLMWQPGR